MVGLFAGALALAADDDTTANGDTSINEANEDDTTSYDNSNGEEEADDGGTVDVEDVEVEGIGSDEIEETLDDLEGADGGKRIGFVKIWKIKGWLHNDEAGTLVNGFWLSHRVTSVDEAGDSSDVSVIKAFGKLHIIGAGNYRLVKKQDASGENGTISFYVIPMNKKRNYADNEVASNDAVGVLTVSVEKEYKGLTTWAGELIFDEGRYKGIWNVEIGTTVKTMKPRQAAALADAHKAARISFWKRIQFWKNWEGNKPGDSDDNDADENHAEQADKPSLQSNAKHAKARGLRATGGAIFNR